jgi:hypothetical protein
LQTQAIAIDHEDALVPAGKRFGATRDWAEEETQSAFRAAQSKYSVLAGYQVLIRKKDQGGRGVFYACPSRPARPR